MKKVFVSYSHNDKKWLEKLRPFFKVLEKKANFDFWSDNRIVPSSQWRGEIEKALFEAEAAIILVSQDFLASDYINDVELPTLFKSVSEKGLRIFPLIVSSFYAIDSQITEFQAINFGKPLDKIEESEQNEVLVKLVKSIDEIISVNTEGITDAWLENFRNNFIAVEGGEYIMGDNSLAKIMHGIEEEKVMIPSFNVSKFVITQAEWQSVMKSQPWLNQSNVRYGNELPAVYINWNDASAFIRTLNRSDKEFYYRLPVEAEWEFAARGGVRRANESAKFCYGNDESILGRFAWFNQNASLCGENYAHAVGQLEPNQLGLFDMHGNIWEWQNNDEGGLKPLRGGGFNFTAEGASSAFRVVNKQEVKGEATGFRLVKVKR